MYAEARWSVHRPLWQTRRPRSSRRLCRLALTSTRRSARFSASPDARIIDVSSSRTSTVPDVQLNVLDHPSAAGLRRRGVRRRRKREGKQVSDDVRHWALISASGLRLLWQRVTSAVATVRHRGAWKLHLMVSH